MLGLTRLSDEEAASVERELQLQKDKICKEVSAAIAKGVQEGTIEWVGSANNLRMLVLLNMLLLTIFYQQS